MPLACALAIADARSLAVATIVSTDGRAASGNLIAQRVALDELRGDVELAVELLQRIDGADAGMRQHRGGASLASQPLSMVRLAGQLRGERLERNGAAEPAVRGKIHAPHAAASDLADDGVGAKHRARLERVVVLEKMRNGFGDRLRQKRAGARMMVEQRPNLRAHDRVVGRRCLEPLRHVDRLVLECGLEQIARARRCCSGSSHWLSSRNSHARASAHRRFNVAGDMPIASAASSTLMPAK